MFSNRSKRAARLIGDRSGSILIPFGLSIAIVSGTIGGAIDFSRWYSAKRVTADAVDAAVLAGARALQLNPGNPQAAIDAANAFYQGNMAGRTELAVNTLTFTVVDNNQAITATGDAAIDATFLRIVGIKKLSIFNTATSVYPKAKIIFGGQGGSNLEISLMLDVTGSMCDDGVGPCTSSTKLTGLKNAATHLIDTVIPETQTGPYTSRMAIVPFSTRVRVGPDGGGGVPMKLLTDLNPLWSGHYRICTSWSGGGGSEGNGTWVCNAYQTQEHTNWKIMPCVTDRFYNTAGRSITRMSRRAPHVG
jgi:Flp pilus assembly protein TadG